MSTQHHIPPSVPSRGQNGRRLHLHAFGLVRPARMVGPAPTHPCRPGFVDAVLYLETRKIVSLARSLIAADAGARRWIYSSALAYGVDANMGRSLTAGATNNCCRACRGSLPSRPPPRYSCVAGVLADLLIHARRAGAGLYGGRGAVHAVGRADGTCVSDGFAHDRQRRAVAQAGRGGLGGARRG